MRWKQNNTVFKFSSQDYLVLARLRGLLGLRGILLKELFEEKKSYHILATKTTKLSPVKSLLPFESPKVTTLHLRSLAVIASWAVVLDYLNLTLNKLS